MSAKQVDAQMILDSLYIKEVGLPSDSYGHKDYERTICEQQGMPSIDALLSQARQEAVEEYKNASKSFPLLSGGMVNEIYQNAMNQPLRERDEKFVTAVASEAWHRATLRHGYNEKRADEAEKKLLTVRREALKEMDSAHCRAIGFRIDEDEYVPCVPVSTDGYTLDDLRQEYSGK
jgi:hypothetical protein